MKCPHCNKDIPNPPRPRTAAQIESERRYRDSGKRPPYERDRAREAAMARLRRWARREGMTYGAAMALVQKAQVAPGTVSVEQLEQIEALNLPRLELDRTD